MDLNEQQILRTAHILKLLGISRSTFLRIRQRGEFPRPVKLAPQCIGWRAADVQAWLESREAA